MIAVKVTNNHCDSRSVRVPGMKRAVKLHPYLSVMLEFETMEDFTGFERTLKKEAPAASIEVINAPAAMPSETAEPLTVAESAVVESPAESIMESSELAEGDHPDSDEGGQDDESLLDAAPEKRKRRSKK